MKPKPKPFILKACSDLFLKAGFEPATSGWEGEDAFELKKEDIRWLVREIPHSNYYEEKAGTYLMVQIAIRDPSLTGTEDPLEWPCPYSGHLGPKGLTEEQTRDALLIFDSSEITSAREQVEKVFLPWILSVANIEWLRSLYERRVEQLKPRRKFFGLIEKRVKERPIGHYFLSLLRWHCGDRQGAIEEAKRYLDLLPDDKFGAGRWYDWLMQAANQGR